MVPSFLSILDIQSWWEIPSIAYFCSLFRTAFNLLDFDIEELEEALLTDGTEDSSSLLTELIVRLLNGCLGNSGISAINYQMYLRRLFRRKCQETGRCNPFDSDIDFQFLPLRTKVEILYGLCDFRLDAEDVCELFKNLDAESLRVEPLGWDDNHSAYWYFYGTRLYREDNVRRPRGKSKKKKCKESKKRGWLHGDDWLEDDETERVWQVVCFTEEDWAHLTDKFSKASSKVEKELYRSLSQNFLPEIPRLFQEKERLQRKRLLELAPRRTSSRVLQKIKQKEEESAHSPRAAEGEARLHVAPGLARRNRASRRNLLRSKSVSSSASESTTHDKEEMSQKVSKRSESQEKVTRGASPRKVEPQSQPLLKTGRKTNNSLASVTGQIVILDNDPVNSNRKRLKTSQIFSQTEEDIQTDMYKVLEQLTTHEDAWPFMDPVEEEYAPNYYAVIRRPMDLRKMEERLDSGFYADFAMFEADFKLIVNNCRLYNGQDNEYTVMVDNLQAAFDRLTEKYIHGLTSSDEEIAVEYQLPPPTKKHKCSEPLTKHKRKKRKSHSNTDERELRPSEQVSSEATNDKITDPQDKEKKYKESHKNKDKKKRKGHHRRRHSKNHNKTHKISSERNASFKAKHNKKQKHPKNKEGKKSKQKKKKIKSQEVELDDNLKPCLSPRSVESSRSRSASPLPSILTPTSSPIEFDQTDQTQHLTDPDYGFKDKYDKIRERSNAPKQLWESLLAYKQKNVDKQKQNLCIPETNKNQKLSDTIEKLRAKNKKYKGSPLFDSLFSSSGTSSEKNLDLNNTEEPLNDDSLNDDNEITQAEKSGKKRIKNTTTKNESASEALKQAVKDISKWLDGAPNSSAESSSCDSLVQTIPTEERSHSRVDDEVTHGEKSVYGKKDSSRKQTSSRDPKLVKRREIQRTIDRLQPGKSKGNLLTNMSNKNTEKEEETPFGSLVKVNDPSKADESSPKLSLGSVLPTVEFSLGNDHSFSNQDDKCEDQEDVPKQKVDCHAKEQEQTTVDKNIEELSVESHKTDTKIETEPQPTNKLSQEKATPNLSAWFKAFGAPKGTNVIPAGKKKIGDVEVDEKSTDTDKSTNPVNTTKFDPLTNVDNPNQDNLESPLLNMSTTPKQRRTSTGSSVSEKSSFSQDLDSPRHQLSHTSPLLRSPASPRVDDFQKITYPIINGTIRAGFYQDTTSIKSSPEKSYSPREAPQSPYSPYPQHVYASNSATGLSTPNYFVDHSKSPLPTYGQNMPPYFDSSKVPTPMKHNRPNEDYVPFGHETYEQGEYSGSFPLAQSYLHLKSTNYPQAKTSPPVGSDSTSALRTVETMPEPKVTLFPVKKRTYNEHVVSSMATRKPSGSKVTEAAQDKNEYQKFSQPLQSTSLSNPSVDDIALSLSEKSELAKMTSLREKGITDSIDRHTHENRATFDNNTPVHESKKDFSSVDFNRPIGMIKKNNVDMVNMGYMNPDNDRKNINEAHGMTYAMARDMQKQNNARQKGFEVEAINLDLSNQQLQKTIDKSNINVSCIQPVLEKSLDKGVNQNIAHADHIMQNDVISGDQSIGKFSLNDIESANRKLFACNAAPTATPLDYGNWKMTNESRKQALASNVSTNTYNANEAEKCKAGMHSTNSSAANYNKSLQHEHSNYAASRIQRAQELQQNISTELRIPNPRGLFKNDHTNIATSNTNLVAKNMDHVPKSQKTEKLVQNHPLVNSFQYKTPYSTHSALPLERLRNLPNIPEMLQRYTNDDRYLASAAGSASALYHDKSFEITQILNKSMASDINPANTSASIYSQPSMTMNKDNNIYKLMQETETKTNKRKKASEIKQMQMVGSQGYHTSSCGSDVLSSVKNSMIPASAFNFGTPTSMGLGGGLFGDNGGFSIEDFRHSNQLMAANYMAATVAHQQRSNAELKAEKVAKPAHQSSSYTSASFPFLGHSQVRAGYPFIGPDPTSPLYQQYLQRQELLRQTGAQIMGLYQPTYPPGLSVRQPYDSITRPSWL